MNILIKKKPSEFITPESINFTELVKNSNTTLSLSDDYQLKMITLLSEEFTEEQQRWYIANLYIYMNYHPTNDYPINLENVFKMIGFANKGNAMKTIKSNFTKDEDYQIMLFHTEKRKNEGGFNKEDVMLNVDTFKNLCMLVKTDKGKEIRKYYVKLENIYNKIIKEDIEQQKLLQENTQKLLDEKETLLQESSQQLEHTKNELQKMSLCKIKKWYNVEPGDTVYAFKNDGEPYIKMGRAESIKKREDGYTVGNRTANIFYYRKCYDCKLTERVIHHILDKHRIEKNREWFDISEELAIYIIDMVCNLLDSFIGCSEELINFKVNEQLSSCLQQANVIETQNQNETVEDVVNNKTLKKTWKNKKKEIKHQEESLKIHFDKFVKEYCEIDENNKCLALEILGAYRMWSKSTDPLTRKNLTTYMKNNYNLKQEYVSEHNTKLTYYVGIKPKEFIIKQENADNLPHYEEFILSKCKFNYTYRTTKTTLFNEFKKWVLDKYPEYIFSKTDQTNMTIYLHRNFFNCKKIHINGGTDGYYGLQMNNNHTELLGISVSRRKQVHKVDINTNEIIETYNTLYEASVKLNIDEKKLSNFILRKINIDGQFIYKYDDDR
jgi:phage anti-repressor protein